MAVDWHGLLTGMRAAWRRAAPLGARDLVAAAPIPLVQTAIGLSLGLPAAGAFQIAARLGSLLDSL